MGYCRRRARLTSVDRVTNEEIKRRMGLEKVNLNFVDEKRLRWHRHVTLPESEPMESSRKMEKGKAREATEGDMK